MRYYCPKCKSELILDNELVNQWIAEEAVYTGNHEWNYKWDGEHVLCDICTDHCSEVEYWMDHIPDFETPKQYEKRTGKKWNGAVWVKNTVKIPEVPRIWLLIRRSMIEDIDLTDNTLIHLCANGPEPPPDDWQPEEGV